MVPVPKVDGMETTCCQLVSKEALLTLAFFDRHS